MIRPWGRLLACRRHRMLHDRLEAYPTMTGWKPVHDESHVVTRVAAMQKRDVIRLVLEGQRPPYVPWSMGFTKEAREKLQRHYGCDDIEVPLQNHLLKLGSDIGFFTDLGHDRVQDVFGVVWDRSVDKDIGQVEGQVLARPTLAGYAFPDPLDAPLLRRHPQQDRTVPRPLPRVPDRFFAVRAGVDAARHGTVDAGLLRPTSIRGGVAGSDCRLQHRPGRTRPCSTTSTRCTSATTGASSAGCTWARICGDSSSCRNSGGCTASCATAGKFVMIHSCGDVDELFDDLVAHRAH